MSTYTNSVRNIVMPDGNEVIVHAAPTGGQNTTLNLKKIKYDDNGHVTESDAAKASDLGLSSSYAKQTDSTITSSNTTEEAIGILDQRSDTNKTNILSVEDMICDTEFSTSTAYAIGDIVTYNNSLYEFTSAHSAGAWNSADVTQIDVVGIIGNINTVLEGVL